MLTFERYSKFDVNSLQAVQIREAIIEDVNRATPAATFEGSLDEWTAKLKDGTQQEIEEFHESREDTEMTEQDEMERSASDLYSVTDGPNAIVYTEKLKSQHCMQLD